MSQEHKEVEIDLREIFYLLRSKAVVILFVTIICGIGAYLGSRFLIAPKFSSTAKIYVLTKSDMSLSLSDLQIGTSLTSDYMELIESRPVMEQVIEDLGLQMDYKGLLESISIDNPTDTRILNITATYTDARVAKSIVEDLVAVAKKKIAQVMQVDEPAIVSPAYLEEQKVSPSNAKNAILAVILAFCVTAGIYILLYIMDDKVKSSEDITKYLGLHTLAMIPDDIEGNSTKKKGRTITQKLKRRDVK